MERSRCLLVKACLAVPRHQGARLDGVGVGPVKLGDWRDRRRARGPRGPRRNLQEPGQAPGAGQRASDGVGLDGKANRPLASSNATEEETPRNLKDDVLQGLIVIGLLMLVLWAVALFFQWP
jgi:hypothetical protein